MAIALVTAQTGYRSTFPSSDATLDVFSYKLSTGKLLPSNRDTHGAGWVGRTTTDQTNLHSLVKNQHMFDSQTVFYTF